MSTILIADDNEDLRAMPRQLLESHGYRVLEAAGGREAVEQTVRPSASVRPSSSWTWECLTWMGSRPSRGRHVPATETEILILSTYDRSEYRTEAVAAGCGGFITKPVEPTALLKSIRFLLRRGEGEASAFE